MDAECSSITLLFIYKNEQCHNPEGDNLNNHYHEILGTYILTFSIASIEPFMGASSNLDMISTER
jgi:hypothetical protein